MSELDSEYSNHAFQQLLAAVTSDIHGIINTASEGTWDSLSDLTTKLPNDLSRLMRLLPSKDQLAPTQLLQLKRMLTELNCALDICKDRKAVISPLVEALAGIDSR